MNYWILRMCTWVQIPMPVLIRYTNNPGLFWLSLKLHSSDVPSPELFASLSYDHLHNCKCSNRELAIYLCPCWSKSLCQTPVKQEIDCSLFIHWENWRSKKHIQHHLVCYLTTIAPVQQNWASIPRYLDSLLVIGFCSTSEFYCPEALMLCLLIARPCCSFSTEHQTLFPGPTICWLQRPIIN